MWEVEFTTWRPSLIAACGTDIFDKAKYTVSDNAENPTAIMVRSAKMHDMEMPESLLAIARAGAGVNNIPVEKCAYLFYDIYGDAVYCDLE